MDITQGEECRLDLSIVKEEFVIEEIEEPSESLGQTEVKIEAKQSKFDTKDNTNASKIRLKSAKKSKQYPCQICGKIFFSSCNRRKHKLIHAEEFKFKCEHCSKMFKVKKYLTRHLRCHAILPRQTCEICNKTYKNVKSMQIHMEKHKNSKNNVFKRYLTCDLCGKLDLSDKEMVEHTKKMHSDQASIIHSCEICGKTYKTLSYYRNHLRLHADIESGIKFSCAKCPLVFRRKDFLEKHLILHAQGKLHTCKICSASFERLQFYRKHLRTHQEKLNITRTKYSGLPTTTRSELIKISREICIKNKTNWNSLADGKLICTVCKGVFGDLDELRKHTEEEHIYKDDPSQEDFLSTIKTESDLQDDTEDEFLLGV
ncbi:zinc finger protein 724-like [Phlebotomus argentipes]|uniref:zinc finger protein 724-like n=1 Tax=Phlebotomus argentipes TaxID=94469 RepID=UPI002892987E|nr:zinc finger protein 724-like [Phlebotomus argentipes]